MGESIEQPIAIWWTLDKVQRNLRGWKAQHLFLARSATVTEAVLEAIPTYTMQKAVGFVRS